MLRTITAVYAYLQPFIDDYLAAIPAENALDDAGMQELEQTFYLNGDIGPALKMPTIEFSSGGFDFSVDMGAYTPSGSPSETIDSVQVLVYDIVYGEWGYGINSGSQTSFLNEVLHDDNFSGTYSLFIDGMKRISGGSVKNLDDVDHSKGFLLHVTTDTGSEFLVGADNAVNLSEAAGARKVRTGDGIQEHANQVGAVPLTPGACPCPVVDMLAELQKSFVKQGVALTEDHLNIKESQPAFSCGDSFKATIRLGSDLEVLESPQKLGQRIQDGDFRAVEPAGYFRGAHYLLQLSFWSWWDPGTGACICQFSWRLVDVRTAVILRAGFVTEPCGNMETAFDSMLGEIEDSRELEFFMLSDADYQIPDCDDGNPCTWDAYDLSARECVHRAKAASPSTLCDDGNLCTVDDKCVLGNCVGTPRDCNDSNICTSDSCDPGSGCVYSNANEGASCDDGDPGTEYDVCTSGKCQGIGPDDPLPNVPRATGQPVFNPNPVTSGYTTIVTIPVTPDTQFAWIHLLNQNGSTVNFTNMFYPEGTEIVVIETPWVNTLPGDVYLEFSIENLSGTAYSHYRFESNNLYSLEQHDALGHTRTIESDIGIAWLTVVNPD